MPLETMYMQLNRMAESIGGGPAPRPGEMRARLLRAMHVKPTFTVRDLCTLCDARRRHAEDVVGRLVRAGEVAKAGHTVIRGHRWAVYRVSDKDRFYLRHCRPDQSNRPDPSDSSERR